MANLSPREILKLFFPDRLNPWDRLALYTFILCCGKESTRWCFNMSQADRLSLTYRDTRQVRVAVALLNFRRTLAVARVGHSGVLPSEVRGCEAAVSAIPALWVEIPYGTVSSSGAEASLPPGKPQAFEVLRAIEHQPSIIVSTDDAVYAFWLLDDLWIFNPDDPISSDKADAKALLDRFQWAVHLFAAEHGWLIPDAGDLTAAFPLPGSLTGTCAQGPRAVLERFPKHAGDARYRRRDFESLPEPPAEGFPAELLAKVSPTAPPTELTAVLERPPHEDPPSEAGRVAAAPASDQPSDDSAPAGEPAAAVAATADDRSRILITPDQHDVNDRPGELRRERDRAVAVLYKLHAPLPSLLANFFEIGSAGIGARRLKEPRALAQQATSTVACLRQLERDPPPPIRGLCLDPGAAAAELAAARDRLEAVLDELDAAEACAVAARQDADAAVAHTQSVAPWVVQTVEGLAGLAQAGCVGVGVSAGSRS